ncbi:MAG TPA: lycopene cyclase family protein, partial [Flavobacterium sp.]|nr:lycopene cyclase family protein [Flavobacterium sp.]
MKHYDYIFAGAGLAALMTVYKMAESDAFNNKSILLIDEDSKSSNDRTWCFWDSKDGRWGNSVSRQWDSAIFTGQDFSRELDLKPYRYNMIRGLDFYKQVFESISKNENITFLNQKVTTIEGKPDSRIVRTATDSYSCTKLFNSIYNKTVAEGQKKYPVLQQHFIGWFIKSEEAVFNASTATLMDFSVEQNGNTRFMYLLPFSETEALIEYTLFSKSVLDQSEYEDAIEQYIDKLGITNYTIVEKERGSIPMSCYPFWKKDTVDIIHIGSAGGWTKASTGYTFRNADKRSDELIKYLLMGNKYRSFHKETRFWYYDLLLLDILNRSNAVGSSIFSALFKKQSPVLIFKFLDEESSILEDLKVIWSCPKRIFVGALL